jgi:hypothetical protein
MQNTVICYTVKNAFCNGFTHLKTLETCAYLSWIKTGGGGGGGGGVFFSLNGVKKC